MQWLAALSVRRPVFATVLILSLTVIGGRLYLGLNDFVTTALDQDAASSLASDPHLQSALAEVGTSNSGMFYVDVPQVLEFAESSGGGRTEDQAHFDSDVKPFLDPLAPFVVVTRNDDGINSGHGFLYVE